MLRLLVEHVLFPMMDLSYRYERNFIYLFIYFIFAKDKQIAGGTEGKNPESLLLKGCRICD